MSQTRRNWIYSLLGTISACTFWQRIAKGQPPPEALCAGTVSDVAGKGIPGLIVQIVERNGRVVAGKTDVAGAYNLSAPISGPYLILFREPTMLTQVLDIRQLTPKKNQALSVTIDPNLKNFAAAYSVLQGVEMLTAWMLQDEDHMLQLSYLLRPSEAAHMLSEIEKGIPVSNDRQRKYLLQKIKNVRALMSI